MNHLMMRRFLAIIGILSVLGGMLGTPSAVQPALAAPTSVTVAGSLDQALGCTNDWDPACADAHLAYDANDDVWQKTWTIPAGNWEYKAALNDSWDENYGLNAAPGGANIPLNLSSSTSVKFYYDDKTHWITDNVNSVIATVPGDYQHLLGCSGDWDPGCLRSWLEDPGGTGVYSFETTALPAGTYQAKVAINESWDENYGLGGVPNGSNIFFTVPADNAKVLFRYNTTIHLLSITTGHSHDNNVEYEGLAHDSRDSLYRIPFGAVNPGTPVMLRFRTYHNDVTGITIRLYDTAVGHEDREPMALVAANADCFDVLLPPGSTCDYYQYTYTPQALGTVYYRFIIVDGTSTAYYSDNTPRYGGVGQATPTEVDNGFRLNVVAADFPVVKWMQDGVMYQIFPDRFRNGSTDNDPKTTDPRYDYPAPANATPQQIQAAENAQILDKAWSDLPEGYCNSYVNPAEPCTQSPLGRDYFGGDLKGVDDKLDYLKSLGVTIIYFNPIFESGSNHGYDTRDYLSVSKYFGSYGYFKKLIADANQRGIKIVLDGVFNHLSSDSPFFDRYHHYTSVGACEDISSSYRSWFNFHDVTPGTGVCVDSQNRPNAATYDGWAGFDSIPVIVKRDPSNPEQPYAPVAQYFYQDPSTSVANYWLKLGTSGWRFDVMSDPSFPSAYWQQLRDITKGIQPDETLIAEAWNWYDNLPMTHGDQADTAMGYRFRNAVLGLLGAVDNKGFAEEDNPNLPPSTFAKRMSSIREDYADATYYTMQNLLDSHDTNRILWSLTPGQDNREDKEFNAANLAVGKAKEQIAALVQMTVPGTPSIYYGDEVSLTGAMDPDDRRPFPWKLNPDGSYVQDPKDKKYYAAAGDHSTIDWYRKLTDIRKNNSVLREGVLTFLLTDDSNQTLSYALRMGDNLAIIVINRNETDSKTIIVPTAPYLRDGVTLTDALGGSGSVTTQGGSFTVTLGALKAAIFVMKSGTDITGPAAPTGLMATANDGIQSTVDLSWTENSDSASYNIYRSPVQGGGYVKIGSASTTTFTDSTVNNGSTYYYVVRGLDALGNEGSNSNEANATPAFPIGYAVLQWPKTINQVITANYTTVYGQIYVAGLTDAGGDPSAILAQVGFGAPGSDPSGWSWDTMTYNPGHTGDNNYEYMGGIRADAVGAYDYLVRFSDDGGRTWVYGDQDGYVPGGSSGTNLPGVMTITPSSDTTAPTAPVASIDYSASSLAVSWTASTDPDDVVAEYRIYRGTAPGAEGAAAIAIVSGTTLSYLDTTVNAGEAYYYTVKAFDTSLNASPVSNEVSHIVEPKVIQVTFRVKVPAFTPPADQIYITGQSQGVSPDPLCNYCGGSASTVMTETSPNIWEITLSIPDGTPIQYKYTRSTYDYVEEWGTIRGFTNRVATVAANSPTDLTQLFDDTSDTNPDDNHKAVQNWRDALVAGTTSSSTAVTATFNWDVKPDGTDFSNAIVVTSGSTTVSGTIAHDATTQSLTFTPNAPFVAGSYTVTVDHVIPLTPQNDGIKIRTPYIFTFTIQ